MILRYWWLRNPAPVENGGKHPILLGFNHPFGGAGFLPSTVFWDSIYN